jgi:transcriptional regulator with XRE-family HTH domain
MSASHNVVIELGTVLRSNRVSRGLTMSALAEQANVSPRLVSAFEKGRRPNVSFEVAVRLLQCVGVSLRPTPASLILDEDAARAERAARRRATWVGGTTTLRQDGPPAPPDGAAARLIAVATASRLAFGLRDAYRAKLEEQQEQPED